MQRRKELGGVTHSYKEMSHSSESNAAETKERVFAVAIQLEVKRSIDETSGW